MGDDTPEAALDAVEAAASAALGVPLPPEVRKSLWKALGALITGLVDVPVAWLEGRSQAIRSEAAARTMVIEAGGEAAAAAFSADRKLVERATLFLGQRLIREQKNRESIAAKAADEIRANPPASDSDRSISEDWLATFARAAETRSEDEMKSYFAKILASEICRPGLFSLATLDVASKLTPEVAQLFQRFCNASITISSRTFVFSAPFGSSETMEDAKLPFRDLLELQDAGLVQSDLNLYYFEPPEIFTSKFELAGVAFQARPETPGVLHPKLAVSRKLDAIGFTRAGRQLRSIVHMTPNLVVVERLTAFLRQFDLELVRLDPPNGNS